MLTKLVEEIADLRSRVNVPPAAAETPDEKA